MKKPDGTWKKIPAAHASNNKHNNPQPNQSSSKDPRLSSQRKREDLTGFRTKSKVETSPEPLPVPPPLPTLPPFTPPPLFNAAPSRQQPPPPSDSWQCKICLTKVDSEQMFLMHLTVTHFRERIVRRIKPPFKCLMCGYSPPPPMPDPEKAEDLLLHYGTTERVAVKFYEETCQGMLSAAEPEAVSPGDNPVSLICRICDITLAGERNFVKHLTLRHFPQTLCNDLPKKLPFRCPIADCSQTKQNLHALMLHYGIDHNVVTDHYNKHPKVRNAVPPKASPGEPSSGGVSVKVELPNTCRSTKLQAVVSPYHPETDDDRSSQMRTPSPANSDIPHFSGMNRNNARKPYGLSSEARRIEELEERIKQMEASHKEKLTEKQSEFERWLASKETRLEEEKARNEELVARLAQRDQTIARLDEEVSKFPNLQEDLDRKTRECDDLLSMKEQFEIELEEKENERINSYEELYNKEIEFESLQEDFKKCEESLEEARISAASEKDLAISLQAKVDQLTKQLEDFKSSFVKVKKELQGNDFDNEKKNNEPKADTPSIKMKITKEKGSLRSAKIQMDNDGHARESPLVDETNSLEEILLKFKSSTEQTISDLKSQLKHEREAKTAISNVKELEKEKKELLKKAKMLESTLSDWESRQFTNVKLIAGLEKERDTLQLKLKEMKDGNLSHEDQLYWKDTAIRNCEKELKSVKSLRETDEKTIFNLGKQLEEANASLEASKSQCKGLETKLSQDLASKEEHSKLTKDLDNKNAEIKHLKMSLTQRTKDLNQVNSTAVCQKKELDILSEEKGRLETENNEAASKLDALAARAAGLEKKVVAQATELRQLKASYSTKLTHQPPPSLPPPLKRTMMKKIEEDNRVETLLRNQVLQDMDAVIKIRESGASPEKDFTSMIIKEEPEDVDEFYCNEEYAEELEAVEEDEEEEEESLTMQTVNPETAIVLTYADEAEILGTVASSPEAEILSSVASSPEAEILGTLASSPEAGILGTSASSSEAEILGSASSSTEADRSPIKNHSKSTITPTRRRKGPSLSEPPPAPPPPPDNDEAGDANNPSRRVKKRKSSGFKANNGSSGKRSKGSKSGLQDVTDMYKNEEGDGIHCGICDDWDPPECVDGGTKKKTEWVGCDCDRWFHRECTGMKRITTKFSCKSLKMECLIIPITSDKVEVAKNQEIKV